MTVSDSVCWSACIIQGHVDFSYEVSRSLAASQGVLLLVDAQQVSKPVTVLATPRAHDKTVLVQALKIRLNCTERWALLHVGDCTHVTATCRESRLRRWLISSSLSRPTSQLFPSSIRSEVESTYIRTCISIPSYSYSRSDNFPIVQIDLPLADVDRVLEQLQNAFGFSTEEALKVYLSLHVHTLSIPDTIVMNANTFRC